LANGLFVFGRGRQNAGVFMEIGSDEYFDCKVIAHGFRRMTHHVLLAQFVADYLMQPRQIPFF